MSHFNHLGRPGKVGGSLPKNNLNRLFLILKGGSGSGNFDHAGIPGHQGGSSTIKSYLDASGNTTLVTSSKELNDIIDKMGNKPKAFAYNTKTGNMHVSLNPEGYNHADIEVSAMEGLPFDYAREEVIVKGYLHPEGKITYYDTSFKYDDIYYPKGVHSRVNGAVNKFIKKGFTYKGIPLTTELE